MPNILNFVMEIKFPNLATVFSHFPHVVCCTFLNLVVVLVPGMMFW